MKHNSNFEEKSKETILFEKALAIIIDEMVNPPFLDRDDLKFQKKFPNIVVVGEKKVDLVNLLKKVDFNQISLSNELLDKYNKISFPQSSPSVEEFQQKIKDSNHPHKDKLTELPYPLKKAIFQYTTYDNSVVKKMISGNKFEVKNIKKVLEGNSIEIRDIKSMVINFAIAQQGLNSIPESTLTNVIPDVKYISNFQNKHEAARATGLPITVNSYFGNSEPSIDEPMMLRYEAVMGKDISPLSARSERKYIISPKKVIISNAEEVTVTKDFGREVIVKKNMIMYTAIVQNMPKAQQQNVTEESSIKTPQVIPLMLDRGNLQVALIDKSNRQVENNNEIKVEDELNKLVKNANKQIQNGQHFSGVLLDFNKTILQIISNNKAKLKINNALLNKFENLNVNYKSIEKLKPKDKLLYRIVEITESLGADRLRDIFLKKISPEGIVLINEKKHVKELKKQVKNMHETIVSVKKRSEQEIPAVGNKKTSAKTFTRAK